MNKAMQPQSKILAVLWVALFIGAGGWFILTLADDLGQSHSSPILMPDGFGTYIVSIVGSSFGLILPLLLVLPLFLRVERSQENDRAKNLRLGESWLLGGAAGILVCFYFVERVFPLSVVPFATSTCAVLFAAISYFVTTHARFGFRITVLSVGVILILSFRFLDWNSRKPFLRDLYHIRIGMTMGEVEQRMAGYLNKPKPDDPPRLLRTNDELIYRPSNEAAYNADWGIIVIKEGKVEAVSYSSD